MAGFGDGPFGSSAFGDGDGGGSGGGGPLVATPEPAHSPPRVRLDFTDTSATVTSLTITRQDASGRTYTVRTSDGGPLQVSGGVATLWDYEAPYGQTITYTTDSGGTASTQLDVPRSWLIHPGVPSRSCPLVFGQGSFGAVTRSIVQGSFTVLGRSTPVITTGGARVAGASQFVLMTETIADADALDLLFSDGSPLFLNVPPSLSYDVAPMYIAVGDVAFGRPSSVAMHKDRSITVPYQTVARPGGGTRAAVTWDVVASQYATWADLAATGLTWAELVAPTS
ncbi:MAG TPA: hypothetical protein VFV01_16895 [Spirillospora sp.]|nr:hypothetical protein [Spirillospora sp.]